LQLAQFSETREYVTFPGTDFQCTIVPAANDSDFIGNCGNVFNNTNYNIRGTRTGNTIQGIGDRPSTSFVDDYVFTLSK
jgi:hypothetical protein